LEHIHILTDQSKLFTNKMTWSLRMTFVALDHKTCTREMHTLTVVHTATTLKITETEILNVIIKILSTTIKIT